MKIPVEWSAQKEGHAAKGSVYDHRQMTAEAKLPGPIPLDRLGSEAKRALDDFEYFRRRYFGRISSPWQVQAINQLVELLHSDEREFVCMNVAPGAGKSALLADFKCWLICKDRAVRMLTGSASQSLASRSLMRVRRSLERLTPLKADEKDLARGVALDAETTLARDFGRFKPLDRELWNRDAFIVMQHEGTGAIEDKEATLTAYGIDSEFTGGRFDFVEWDDLVSPKMVGSAPYREGLELIYTKTCEPRVEPEGLLVLCGQRLAADDLYRVALDMVRPPDDDEDDDEVTKTEDAPIDPDDRSNMKYRHIAFKAHYQEKCQGHASHSKKAPAYPEGCLLDPRRLPWRDLSSAQANNPSEYSLVYQQEDADPAKSLVRREWVYGDDEFVGCIDDERQLWEIPADVSSHECLVYATADPSPTMFWSVQMWVYHAPTQRRILVDHVRRKMRMPEMLDRDASGKWSGVMHEWQDQSERLGFPIQTWIIEHNAAQRFMLQQTLVRDWRIMRGVDIVPHSTGINKADPKYGVWSLGPLWRQGRVRLPFKGGDTRLAVKDLIEEAIAYDHGRTDDCVMSMWMGEWNLPNLVMPEDTDVAADRPRWVLEAAF